MRLIHALARLTAVFGVGYFCASACSTIEEPAPEEGPADCNCSFSDEIRIDCQVAIHNADGSINSYPSAEEMFPCVPQGSSSAVRDQVCLDACEKLIEPESSNYCDFFDDDLHHFETGCQPWGGTGGADTCPGWYDPSNGVFGYSESGSGASVTVYRSYLEDIRENMYTIYVCDGARYEEGTNGVWTFTNVDAGDLLYAIGIRTRDAMASVQGFDPATGRTTTPEIVLDDAYVDFQSAYIEMMDEAGVILRVRRSGNSWPIRITLR